MKIKYNIPMLNEIKNRVNNITTKVERNKENKKKVPMKYYTLLILMLAVGIITISANTKRYGDMNAESYTKYTLDSTTPVESNKIQNIQYETAVSSISTNVSNMEENVEESDNNGNVSSIAPSKKYIYPIDGDIIKDYAMDTLTYSKTLDMWRIHQGIDIAAPVGSAVAAVQDGKVIKILTDNFYGNTVKIEHSDGYVSVYSNLEDIKIIQEGEEVKQGDIIGKIGASAYGEIADDSHLHFELLKNNEWVNPMEIME